MVYSDPRPEEQSQINAISLERKRIYWRNCPLGCLSVSLSFHIQVHPMAFELEVEKRDRGCYQTPAWSQSGGDHSLRSRHWERASTTFRDDCEPPGLVVPFFHHFVYIWDILKRGNRTNNPNGKPCWSEQSQLFCLFIRLLNVLAEVTRRA